MAQLILGGGGRRRLLDVDKASFTSFTALGGRSVSVDEVRRHLAELPLDLVLGVLARITGHSVRAEEFFSAQSQGRYLAYALADDFPGPLLGAAAMYAPGRVPITGGRHNFIHEHGLAALAQLAVLHCPVEPVTERISLSDFGRIGRLILILNDHLSRPSAREGFENLRGRRSLAIDLLSAYQFNSVAGYLASMVHLGRAHRLLTEFLPRHLPDAAERFADRAGIGLNEYLLIAAMLIGYADQLVGQVDEERSPWMSVDSIVANLKAHGGEVWHVLRLLCQKAPDLRNARTGRPHADLTEFAELQRRPLIEARAGEIIAPVWSLLIRQLLSFPFQVLATIESGRAAFGFAYEEYAHGVIERIARSDRPGPWRPMQGQKFDGGEVDSLLWRDTTAVVFEHKSKGLLLTLGNRSTVRNALGPTDDELAQIGTRWPSDTSGLTHGMWQLATLSKHSDDFFMPRVGCGPQRVVPVITTLEHFHVDDWVRRIYLEPLLAAAGVRFPAHWSPIQWLHVTDIEALAQLAEDGELDLAALFEAKAATPERFDWFLAKQFGNTRVDRSLADRGRALIREASLRYFGHDPAPENPN
jgi:hypothetical protein